MSGGSLEYGYQKLEWLAEEIEAKKIEFNNNDLTEQQRKIVVNEITSLQKELRVLAQRAKNLEWWLSGDDGDKEYFESIQQRPSSEDKELYDVISDYAKSFNLLQRYDSNNLQAETNGNVTYEINYNDAVTAIAELKKYLFTKKETSSLFANQKDDSFKGILGNIVQSFNGEYLYRSIEEQAAHLLYFIIKNHPFSDGNKRIGAFLFIWFLEKNKYRFKSNGELKINDNALVAVALLVAQSNPNEKELMIQLIASLLAGK
ncbi:MAG: Fic family protein [Bacteroidetes bacterium]|nr:Fic family protein [Bacteroidota bacterium]